MLGPRPRRCRYPRTRPPPGSQPRATSGQRPGARDCWEHRSHGRASMLRAVRGKLRATPLSSHPLISVDAHDHGLQYPNRLLATAPLAEPFDVEAKSASQNEDEADNPQGADVETSNRLRQERTRSKCTDEKQNRTNDRYPSAPNGPAKEQSHALRIGNSRLVHAADTHSVLSMLEAKSGGTRYHHRHKRTTGTSAKSRYPPNPCRGVLQPRWREPVRDIETDAVAQHRRGGTDYDNERRKSPEEPHPSSNRPVGRAQYLDTSPSANAGIPTMTRESPCRACTSSRKSQTERSRYRSGNRETTGIGRELGGGGRRGRLSRMPARPVRKIPLWGCPPPQDSERVCRSSRQRV